VYFLSFSCSKFQEGVGDKPKRNADGQTVGKGDDD
jgi:hypothetical protein